MNKPFLVEKAAGESAVMEDDREQNREREHAQEQEQEQEQEQGRGQGQGQEQELREMARPSPSTNPSKNSGMSSNMGSNSDPTPTPSREERKGGCNPYGSAERERVRLETYNECGEFVGESMERSVAKYEQQPGDMTTPPLKKRLKEDFQLSSLHSVRLPSGNSGLKLLSCAIDSANSHYSKFTPCNLDGTARCSEFGMCKSPYPSRLLSSITNTYLSPTPYPLLTFDTPSKYYLFLTSYRLLILPPNTPVMPSAFTDGLEQHGHN